MLVLGLFITWDNENDKINKIVKRLIRGRSIFDYTDGAVTTHRLSFYAHDIILCDEMFHTLERFHRRDYMNMKRLFRRMTKKIDLSKHSLVFAWKVMKS